MSIQRFFYYETFPEYIMAIGRKFQKVSLNMNRLVELQVDVLLFAVLHYESFMFMYVNVHLNCFDDIRRIAILVFVFLINMVATVK